jgi:hypothetical protein
MIPIPEDLQDLAFIEFRRLAKEDSLDERKQLPDSPHSPYMRITLNSNKNVLIFTPRTIKQDYEMKFDNHKTEVYFDLQFPRMVIAGLLGKNDREDWKRCVETFEEESQETERMRGIYTFE